MVIAITVKCDWAGCKATLTYECERKAPDLKGWKRETYDLHSMHLCPAHRRNNWFKVKEQTAHLEHHSTPGESTDQRAKLTGNTKAEAERG
jgi:hypothetical protein